MQTLSPDEMHNLLTVTALSLAKCCGLTGDSQNLDEAQSDMQRRADLVRQLGVLRVRPLSQIDVVYSEFSAKYLPELVAKYKTFTAPCNTAATMINAICHLPYFVRYQKTPAASDLVVLQANRLANAADELSDPEIIGETCQLLSTLLVLQGTTGIPEDVRKRLVQKLDVWRRQYDGVFPGETSSRCYQSLKGSFKMVAMSKMVKDTLEKPLDECGARECHRCVGSVGPDLKRCSRQVQVSSILLASSPKAALARA